MNNNYLVNCEYSREREADYDARDKVLSKFEGTNVGDPSGTNGNLASCVAVSKKTGKVKLGDTFSARSDLTAPLYQAIPSALMLYRLCSTFEGKVESYGSEGYKCVWAFAVKHKETGEIIYFGEHKGATSFWTKYYSAKDLDSAFKKDLVELLNYLLSPNCAHPYDGLVAGSVA